MKSRHWWSCGLLVALTTLGHAAEDPARSCGVAHTRLQAGFAKSALALAPLLCKDPAQFNERATALVDKTNRKIAGFNEKFASYGCDADVVFPVADKDTTQVALVLRTELRADQLDRFCNGLDDADPVSSPLHCGNGIVDTGEACDAGGQSATCDFDCTLPACGDGEVNAAAGEQCDDGPGGVCPDNCQVPFCGDGAVEGVEQCDDGNSVQTDGCKNDCTLAYCGDSFLRTGVEQCDDGNLVLTDACANCSIATCGDGFIRTGVEECDDGNATSGDGCSFCQTD